MGKGGATIKPEGRESGYGDGTDVSAASSGGAGGD